MNKYALLVGVGQYSFGLNPLKRVLQDVAELAALLNHKDVGGFKQVRVLNNPNKYNLDHQFEVLCRKCEPDDLLLFYYSGHAVKDDFGKLHLTNRTTKKDKYGNLSKASATPSHFFQEVLEDCRSKRQVIILDCCFSGAIARGWTIKDDGSVAIEEEFGKKGRAVLASSTSTQYSFESDEEGGSIYTRQLIHGLRTGQADRDSDGWISVEELHEYAVERLRGPKQRMTPEIIPFMEGYKIKVAKRVETPIELEVQGALVPQAKRAKKSEANLKVEPALLVAPTQQEVAKPAQQEVKPARQEVVKPAKQEVAKPAKQEVAKPQQQEVVKPAQQEVVKPPQQEAAKPPQQEVVKPPQQEAAKPPPAQQEALREQESTRSTPQEEQQQSGHPANQESAPIAPKASDASTWTVVAYVLETCFETWDSLERGAGDMVFTVFYTINDSKLIHVCAAVTVLIIGYAGWGEIRHQEPFKSFDESASKRLKPVITSVQQAVDFSSPQQNSIDHSRLINQALEYQRSLDATPIGKEELETKIEAIYVSLIEQSRTLAGKTLPDSKNVDALIISAHEIYGRAISALEKHEQTSANDLFAEAIAKYSEVVKLDPACAEAYNGRACAELQLNNFAQARQDFAHALALEPSKTPYWRNLGSLFVRSKDMDNAVASYVLGSKFSLTDKNNVDNSSPEGKLVSKIKLGGDDATAAKKALGAIGLYLIRQSIIAEEQGRGDMSKALLSRLEKTFPADPAEGAKNRNIGIAVLKTNPVQARMRLYGAVFFNVRDDLAWNNLALVYADQNNVPRATACFTLSYRLAQGIPGTNPEKYLIQISKSGDSQEIKTAAANALKLIRSGVVK